MHPRVFLDLEQTIIDEWSNPVLINVGKISNFLRQNNVDEIEIFSFAIWDENDVQGFYDMKEALEDVLSVRITIAHRLENVAKIVNKHNRFQLELAETVSLWGKAKTFEDFIEATCRDSHCILIDDVVPTKRIDNKDTGNIIELFNVNRLLESGVVN